MSHFEAISGTAYDDTINAGASTLGQTLSGQAGNDTKTEVLAMIVSLAATGATA